MGSDVAGHWPRLADIQIDDFSKVSVLNFRVEVQINDVRLCYNFQFEVEPKNSSRNDSSIVFYVSDGVDESRAALTVIQIFGIPTIFCFSTVSSFI